jgi:hypothetical protein
MKTPAFIHGIFFPFIISAIFVFQACQKTAVNDMPDQEMTARPRPSNPTPPVFSNPVVNGSFTQGSPANVTVTLSYSNGLGRSYPSFTSATINGIKITTPAGILSTGTGSISFTASGTPVAAGSFSIPVSILGSAACNVQLTAGNSTGSNGDPGTTPGSTGTVSFNYQNQTVTYKTVRAADGKIWLQQNLGSPRVASSSMDEAAFGDFFQWGRWDDGHQKRNSTAIEGSPALQNPQHITPGNPGFIKGQSPGNAWWSTGGLSTDTWSGNVATSVNGKDPCFALGTGWRIPTAADWETVIGQEGISNTINGFQSNLKLASGSLRFFNNGLMHFQGDVGYYWTSTAEGSNAKALFIDNAYGLFILPTERGKGFPCRCVKN